MSCSELICPHTIGLRPPSKTTPVFKEECTKCFDDDLSPGGLNICLSCFNGSCVQQGHTLRHYSITSHPLVLNIQRVEVPTTTKEETFHSAAASDHESAHTINDSTATPPPAKITKLALNLPGGVQVYDKPLFSYHLSAQCLKCQINIPIQSYEERETEKRQAAEKRARGETFIPSAKNEVDEIVDSVLSADSANRPADDTWEDKPLPCEHSLTLVQDTNAPILTSKHTSRCNNCDINSSLWLCLTCGNLGCARKNWDGSGGNNHAIDHYTNTKHPLVVKTGTIDAEGKADVYCYLCDNTVIDEQLASHLQHFGINASEQTVTEKTTAQLSLELNLNKNWSVVLNEDGAAASLLFGPGHTGFRNLGNSCYMASALQLIFSVPAFIQRYWIEGKEHEANCRNGRPSECFHCQMYKLVDGLMSGRYAVKPTDEELKELQEDAERERSMKQLKKENGIKSSELANDVRMNDISSKPDHLVGERKRRKQLQPGIPPRTFKRLIARDHPEFSTGKQQDALEFIHYFFTQVQQKERVYNVDPTATFQFKQEDRLECGECHAVRYTTSNQTELSVPIPLPPPLPSTSTEPLTLAKDGKPRKEELQYPPIPLQNCIKEWAKQTSVEGYNCPHCRHVTTAHSSSRFITFPSHLMLVMRRFLFNEWIPTKLDAEVIPTANLNIGDLTAKGLQPGEIEMKSQSSAAPVEVADASIVSQLESMGFSKNACTRAALAVKNSNGDDAMNWLLSHMEDADVNDPISTITAANSNSSSKNSEIPPSELVEQLEMMGFPTARCVYALQQTNNSPDRAVEWLFSHAEEELPSSQMHNTSSASDNIERSSSISSSYRLLAAITHLGKSTSTGHYVCHLRREGRWVLLNDEKVSLVSDRNDGSGVGKGMERAYIILFEKV